MALKFLAYVPNSVSDDISVIQESFPSQDTPFTTISLPVGSNPYGCVLWGSSVNQVSTLCTRAYVSNAGNNTVSVINTHTNQVIATIPVGDTPRPIAIDNARAFVYVGNYADNSISVIRTSDNTVVATLTGISTPSGITGNYADTILYVTNYSNNTVSLIDISNPLAPAFITTVGVGTNPIGINITPAQNDSRVFVITANSGSNNITFIDVSNNSVFLTKPVGVAPFGVAVNSNFAFQSWGGIYVSNSGDSTVTIIEPNGFGLFPTIATTPTAGTPFGIVGGQVQDVFTALNSADVLSRLIIGVTGSAPVGDAPISLGNFVGAVDTPIICPTISLSPAKLGNGLTIVSYNGVVTASGGTAPYSYAITAGALPSPLVLNSSNGQITGLHPAYGMYSFTVTATDANGCQGSRTYTIFIYSPFVGGNPVTKTFTPSTVAIGQVSTLTISVGNAGDIPITGVTINDIFPAGMVVAPTPNESSTIGGTFSPSPVSGDTGFSFSGGTIAPHSTGVITIDVIATTDGVKGNSTGTVAFDTGNLNSGSGTLTVTDGNHIVINPNGSDDICGDVSATISGASGTCFYLFISGRNRWGLLVCEP